MSRNRHWRSAAVCRDVDPELFFPTAAAGAVYDAQVLEAKSVCRRCPVVAACLTDALARAPYGIAGGLTEDERPAARTARRGTSAATAVQQVADTDPVTVDRVARCGPQPGVTRDELTAAAGCLLGAGQSIAQVAERLGLAERTVSRCAASTRAAAAAVAS